MTDENCWKSLMLVASTSGHHEMDVAVTYTEQYSNLVSTPTSERHGKQRAERRQ
jgi:hypothetical protein